MRPTLHSGPEFQFWTFAYASGDSIPYSAHLLRQSLRRTRRMFDPDLTDAAFDRMVVVGHSLGGILAKMMVQSGGPRLWQTVCARPIDQVIEPTSPTPARAEAASLSPCRRPALGHLHRDPPLRQPSCQRPSSTARYTALLAAQPVPPGPGSALVAQRPRHVRSRIPRRPRESSVGELTSGHPLLLRLCELGINTSVRSQFGHRGRS